MVNMSTAWNQARESPAAFQSVDIASIQYFFYQSVRTVIANFEIPEAEIYQAHGPVVICGRSPPITGQMQSAQLRAVPIERTRFDAKWVEMSHAYQRNHAYVYLLTTIPHGSDSGCHL